MARRRLSEQPTSRLAIWSRRIALFSLAATLIAVIVVRSGALEIVPALSTLGGALVLRHPGDPARLRRGRFDLEGRRRRRRRSRHRGS